MKLALNFFDGAIVKVSVDSMSGNGDLIALLKEGVEKNLPIDANDATTGETLRRTFKDLKSIEILLHE